MYDTNLMAGESLGGWILGTLGALATVAAAALTVWAVRRDRAQDKLETLAAEVGEQGRKIARIEGHLNL